MQPKTMKNQKKMKKMKFSNWRLQQEFLPLKRREKINISALRKSIKCLRLALMSNKSMLNTNYK